MRYTVTITFMDGSTRQRTFTSKREALANERQAIKSRIVMFATTKGETA
jgi:hypothetical protein